MVNDAMNEYPGPLGYFEPLKVTPNGNIRDVDDELVLDCDHLYPVSLVQGSLIGRTRDRIIACFNGCKDVTNEQLAAQPVAALITERASVLAALKDAIVWVEDIQTMLRKRDLVDASDSARMALKQLKPLAEQLEAGKVKAHEQRMVEVEHGRLTMIQDAITEALGWMRDQHQDRDVDDKSFSDYLAEAQAVVDDVLARAEDEAK